MSWIPIEESGVLAVAFESTAGYPETNIPTFANSIVSALDASGESGSYPGRWTLDIENLSDGGLDVQLRVSISDYLAKALPVAALKLTGPTGIQHGDNDSASPDAWLPNPWVAQSISLPAGEVIQLSRVVDESSPDSGRFLVEVWVDGPEPPVGRVDADANERTYTASQSADTALTTWIRGVGGRVNLASIPLEVVVSPYPRGHERLTVPATGDALGKVEWNITAEQAKKIGQGLYKIIIRRADKGELLHRGTLEVQF